MLDLIIKGGQVVTPQAVGEMDVGIQGEKIVAVGWPGTLDADAARVIDARGKVVIPGGIEPHAHIGIPVPAQWGGNPDVMTQPPEAASRAAAFGGVTTIIDFAGNLDLEGTGSGKRGSIMQILEQRRDVFRTHSYTDFTFHYILAGEVPPEEIGEIGEAIQEGVASFKIFTTFHPIRVPYGHLWTIFAEVAKHGGIMAVHAEEDEVVRYMTEKLKREGRAQGYNLHLVHNNISEDLAFRHIIRLAKNTGVGIYLCIQLPKRALPPSPKRGVKGNRCMGRPYTITCSSLARTTRSPAVRPFTPTRPSNSPTTVTPSPPA